MMILFFLRQISSQVVRSENKRAVDTLNDEENGNRESRKVEIVVVEIEWFNVGCLT